MSFDCYIWLGVYLITLALLLRAYYHISRKCLLHGVAQRTIEVQSKKNESVAITLDFQTALAIREFIIRYTKAKERGELGISDFDADEEKFGIVLRKLNRAIGTELIKNAEKLSGDHWDEMSGMFIRRGADGSMQKR
ncbi:hypothetical protein [Hydrogenimonas sp.]